MAATSHFPHASPRGGGASFVFASSGADARLVAVALLHGAVLAAIVVCSPRGIAAASCALIVAFATVYTSNTVSHCHLHRPLFASRVLSRALSLWLTAVLFVPQTAWKQRHLWHHAGEPDGRAMLRFTRPLAMEAALVAAVVVSLVALRPFAFLAILVPGFALGMVLCSMQGQNEHAGNPDIARSGVSTYGKLYNAFWFNDGYHAEHHRYPNVHWTELPRRRDGTASAVEVVSGRAPLLRWLERRPDALVAGMLGALERCVLRSELLQGWMVRCHAQAFRTLLARIAPPRRIAVVGGGLFPRTVLVLERLSVRAEVVVIDASRTSIGEAERHLAERGARAPKMVHASFDPSIHAGFDLVIFPLAFVGDASLVEAARKTNGAVIVHDWLANRRRGAAALVSLFLLKTVVLLPRRAS